ncbi:putative multidrug protein [Lasiosphaeria ovina]|uniref:Multidrug protein n=1 Tax=Lasiosphaeria ovina TaxID=92902 RepID=A0AAE0NMX7_9PEZI|nr:putative multidrug protein [Lasiosphaeria ovina]
MAYYGAEKEEATEQPPRADRSSYGSDLEKEEVRSKSSSKEAGGSSSESGAVGFEPINAAPLSRKPSWETTAGNSLSRERSNNGWGVDDLDVDGLDEEEAGGNAQSSSAAAAAATSSKPAAEGGADPFEVGWEGGDNDPANPRSMPTWRKWTIIGVTSFGSFCVTNASAIYTASYGQMDAEFGSSRIVATLGLSMFVLGIALGPFWSPLAEFYGRRPIYLCSFASFMLFIIGSAVAQNIQTMITVRFFQGLSGSAFLSVSGGTVGDLFTRDTMLAPMTIFALAPFIGPSLGPLFGGLINTYTSWRWTHYVLLIWSFTLLVCIALFVPETYHPVLLQRKAEKLRKETGDNRWRAPIEKTTRSMTKTLGYALLRPFQILIMEPMCLILDVYSAVLLGMLYLFFGAFPLVFTNSYGFNLWQVGLSFMGLLVAMILAVLSTPIWRRVRELLVEKRRKETGVAKSEPEDQLPPLIFGAPLITGGLFWFGFTTYPHIHWIVPIIGSGFFGLG